MVYRSFDKVVSQAEIFPKIAKYNHRGSLAAATHLIALDALNRGFAAVAIQARHPLQTLRLCLDNGIRVILNHRLKEDVSTGHFTVLVDIDAQHVVLHDPFLGPSRRVGHAELIELWRPRYLNAEISGNVLIGIADAPAPLSKCSLCGAAISPSVPCPNCTRDVALKPAVLLACLNADCPARMWNYLCCPSCDFTWDLNSAAMPAKPGAGQEKQTTDLAPVLAELDKFCARILSAKGMADNPDVKHHLSILQAGKEDLKLAESEGAIYRKTHAAQVTQFEQITKQNEQAFRKRKEELGKLAPSLDGNALGQALVRELGFLGSEPSQQAIPSESDPEFVDYLRKKGRLATQ
jgi:hypothetical protein